MLGKPVLKQLFCETALEVHCTQFAKAQQYPSCAEVGAKHDARIRAKNTQRMMSYVELEEAQWKM